MKKFPKVPAGTVTRDERYSRVSDQKAYQEGLERIFGKKWAKRAKQKAAESKRTDEAGN